MPVIEGSNHDEFTIFGQLNIEFVFGRRCRRPSTRRGRLCASTVGLQAIRRQILAQYPLGNQSMPQALSTIGTDAIFACPARRAAQALSKFAPTFAYEFNDPNAPQLFVPPASFPYGAYHAAEVQYLFDLPNPLNAPALNADQQQPGEHDGALLDEVRAGGRPERRRGAAVARATPAARRPVPVAEPPDAGGRRTGFAADHKCEFWDARVTDRLVYSR